MEFEHEHFQEAPDWAVRKYAKMQENILVNLKWWLFGMPSADELRHRYSPRRFTEEEEERIREIARIVADELDDSS